MVVTVRTAHHVSLEVESVRRDGAGVSVRKGNISLWRDSVKVLKIFFFFSLCNFFLCISAARISTDAVESPCINATFVNFAKKLC